MVTIFAKASEGMTSGWSNANTPESEKKKGSRKEAMIELWKAEGYKYSDSCSVGGCRGKFDHGAHVKHSGDEGLFLVKMCVDHNEQKEKLGVFSLKDNAPVIKAVDLP
jgi:hypothetical protein